MKKPLRFVSLTLYVEADTDYEAEENVRALLDEHKFEEGDTFTIDDSGITEEASSDNANSW